MRVLAGLLAALVVVCATGCTNHTEYGPCIGAFDAQDPNLRYSANGINIAIGIIFFELIAPPVVVITSETLCPVGPAYKQADPRLVAPTK